MAKNMSDEQINKIAQTIAAKLAEPAGPGLLGCGSASSSQYYECTSSSGYGCSGYYECGGGGAGDFRCGRFTCYDYFNCPGNGYSCVTSDSCQGTYSS